MSIWLDLIGSYLIGGMILLILLNLNSTVSTAASENLHSGIMQRNVTSTADLIEHDIYKIGYRVAGAEFAIADSNEIKFSADVDDDGAADVIHYYCGDTTGLNGTNNPNDFLLIREINAQKPGAKTVVVDFNVTYFDSLSQQINFALLKTQAGMNQIKSIRIKLKCETEEKIDDHYEAAEWEKIMIPKNL